MSYVIVGASAAGLSAAQTIREVDKQSPLTIISQENFAYSRIGISKYLTGETSVEQISLAGGDYFRENRIEARFNARVVEVRPPHHTVILENGEEIPYGKLLLATGSSPVVPKIPGVGKGGVFTFWTLKDAQEISDFLRSNPSAGRAIVVGGGLIGFQAALALKKLGLRVTVVEKLPSIFPAILDRKAVEIVERKLHQSGLQMVTGAEVQALLGEEKVSAVKIDNREVKAEVVILAVGVKPNIAFLKDSAIAVRRGIITDEKVQTSEPDVYAAGDVAEVVDLVDDQKKIMALWPNAVVAGRAAGHNMANPQSISQKFILMNSMHIDDLYLITLGASWVEEGEGFDILQIFDPRRNFYRKLICQGDRLVGAILVGDTRLAGFLHILMSNRLNMLEMLKPLMRGQGYYNAHFALHRTKWG